MREWFGVLGAPLAWAIDELVSLYAHEGSCTVLGLHNADPVLVVTGVLMLAVAGAAFVISRKGRVPSGDDTAAIDQRPFMARAGTIISAVFLFGILLRFLGVFFVAPCRY